MISLFFVETQTSLPQHKVHSISVPLIFCFNSKATSEILLFATGFSLQLTNQMFYVIALNDIGATTDIIFI